MAHTSPEKQSRARLLVLLAIFCMTVGIVLTLNAVYLLRFPAEEEVHEDQAWLVATAVEQALDRDAVNIPRARNRLAAEQTAAFIDENMNLAIAATDAYQLLDLSLQAVNWNMDGHNAEFGVYRGTTVNYIAKKIRDKIRGKDFYVEDLLQAKAFCKAVEGAAPAPVNGRSGASVHRFLEQIVSSVDEKAA